MTLTIDLTPSEEARLAEAARLTGLPPAEAAHSVLAKHLPAAPDAGADPTLALFARWDAEDAGMTPEEAAEERRLWERFEAGINETRAALGMRRL